MTHRRRVRVERVVGVRKGWSILTIAIRPSKPEVILSNAKNLSIGFLEHATPFWKCSRTGKGYSEMLRFFVSRRMTSICGLGGVYFGL